jgi:hypothetical protein
MVAVKTKRISTLIETQLPEFISTEYELFSKFVTKYYEAQEVQGGTLDIINNIQKYADIDYYEKNLLRQHDTLDVSITNSSDTIVLQDARSFPEKDGYIRIDDEIIFYATRTDTTLSGCSRGVSGNTKIGDLYSKSNFVSTTATAHAAGQTVYNISNLFLYALVKNFEKQYLGSFPEKYLRGSVDKRTLIKNIQNFYKAKGTDSSIKFVFNSIIDKDFDPLDRTNLAQFEWFIKSEFDNIAIDVTSPNGQFLVGDRIKTTTASGEIAKIVRNDQNVITRVYLRQVSSTFSLGDSVTGTTGSTFTASTVYTFPNGIFYINFGKLPQLFGDFEYGKYYFAPEGIRIFQNWQIIWNQSDPSNLPMPIHPDGHPMKFSTTREGTLLGGQQYYNSKPVLGVKTNYDNEFQPEFMMNVDESNKIYYYCAYHRYMSGLDGDEGYMELVANTRPRKIVKPEVYKPRDFTYKASNADWINVYALKCKVISGDVKSLVGKKIVQSDTEEYDYADAVVDNVYADGTRDDEVIYNIVLAPETVNGTFGVSTKTQLEKVLIGTKSKGDRIDVFSTTGWDNTGSVLIGDETITFSEKTVGQFIIDNRLAQTAVQHDVGTPVYKPVTIAGSGVTLLTMGIVYNLQPSDPQPYSFVGDKIQVSNPGFETSDSKIVNVGTNQTRWILGTGAAVNVPTLSAVATSLDQVPTNVSAILADDQYYYIASSSFPSHKILDGSTVTQTVLDQKLLRIIRKQATRTTETYPTPKRDIGIGLNGVPFYGYKDAESIRYGKLEQIKVDLRGTGYVRPPFVLIDQVPNKARAILAGQVVESISVDTTDVFPRTPDVLITSGRNAAVRAVVTGGKVTSLILDNAGEFYSSPPQVVIRDNAGRGRFAEFEAVVNTDGQITGFNKIAEGNFYNQNTVIVEIVPVGSGATGIPLLKEWNFNRYKKLETKLDTENGYVFGNSNNVLEYGYGYAANPKALRVSLSDNLNSAGTEPASKSHSPIIGFAYDGNPIYGAFGYQDPLDSTSSITRMTSSYSINGNRSEGPDLTTYPIGTFVNDYTYTHKSGTLDENNGRFCTTPEFPQGTYAYFITIDSNQVPQYPYIIGENFYSLPVDSNYNSDINQNDIPKKARRFYQAGMPRNGDGFIAQIEEVKQGNVESVSVLDTSANFSINSQLYFDNTGTQGSEAEAIVSSVKGKDVSYLQSKENKVVKLTIIQSAYLFADDTLSQPTSGASGTIVGTVKNDSTIVLKNVTGTFNNTGTFSAAIKTFDILLDQRSSYTKGAILSLTDGVNAPIATAEVLEGTSAQNVVQIKVLTGTWTTDNTYFIQSNDLFNTSGTRIVTLTSLSDGLEPFEVNQSVALIETTSNHGLGIGDNVTIDINPDDATKTKTYYIRKRLYQEAVLIPPNAKTNINFTGIGRYEILNGGADYTAGTYTSIALTGGSGSGATATFTVSSAGVVSGIQIQDAGVGYARGDYLGVADEDLVRSGASQSTSRFTIYVGHVGVAVGATKVTVDNAQGFATDDFIQIGQEVLKIAGINGNDLSVTRGQEGTTDVDHFDGQEVSLYNAQYNFTNNYQIFSGSLSGYIQSYDPITHKIVVVYDYATLNTNANKVVLSSSFFDTSTPQRLVAVRSAEDVVYKFEFSEDNSTFVPNPNIDLQEFYKYKFDTSHSSLTGTYFDISPSSNYNLITVEKIESTILPGNAGAFTDVKFGFGSRLTTNTYQTKTGTDFTNFYYFDNKNVVNSGGSYFKLVTDPLQGTKTINYVTPNRFVYDVTSTPLWDGSGSISYTTNGQFAIGKINTVGIINLGLNYKKVPVITGVDPAESYRAAATVTFDAASQTITGVDITNEGSNYVNPKIVITKSDGSDVKFNVLVREGKVTSITVEKPGRGYTYAPEILIVEGEVEAFVESTSIGVPQSVRITSNGGAFHLDETVSSTFRSNYVLALKNYNGNFRIGEQVVQKINGVEVFRATVVDWRFGSNLLKVENSTGIVREDVSIESTIMPVSGIVQSIFVTTFSEEISSFYDNLGFYQSDKGKLGVQNQKIIDSLFYQDYSYVIKSGTSIEQWRDLIKATTHPAGFKLFGQVDIEATANFATRDQGSLVELPKDRTPDATHFTVVQLWDPEKNKITVENSSRIVTQTVQKVENQRIRKGFGTAATSEFNFNEAEAFEFTLGAVFDGAFDNDGRLQGTTAFTTKKDGVAFNLADNKLKNMIVTLDGVIQEPGIAYTINSGNITFSQPPLVGVTFYGKVFKFKDEQYNTKYFKKLRNIFQRGGTWIDSANQIERNVQFIIDETIGYGKATHPSLDWSTKQDDYEANIRAILDAYQHDIRFGGNIKTIDYASIFSSGSAYLYIRNYKTQSNDIFEYATRLAKLAIRNWDFVDVNIAYVQGQKTMTVSSTKNLAVGLFVSSGKSYPTGTKIVSIDSDTQVTLNNAALANSGGGGGAPSGTTPVSGTGSTTTIGTSTAQVPLGSTFTVPPGATVTVPLSFSGTTQAKFGWSALNNGMFYKAGELIEKNETEIIQLALNATQTQYPNLGWGGGPGVAPYYPLQMRPLIQAYVYHLKMGGNFKIVENAQAYYKQNDYPYGEELYYDASSLGEVQKGITGTVESTIFIMNEVKNNCIQAMRNQLSITDPNVLVDSLSPVCAEVESTLNTYHDITETIITEGRGLVEKTPVNQNKSGYWTGTVTYSNYNILGDPLLPVEECTTVISAMDSLYENLSDVVKEESVTRSLPDYIDGETTDFELYWDDNTEVNTEEDEDLFLTINSVLQRPKFTENYPLKDAYWIDRTVIPNVIKFDTAPIWDQDLGAKSIGEPTAVEKVVGIGVSNYKRLTIDFELVDGVRNGPFLILDVLDGTVQSIESEDSLYVFLDGVLQVNGKAYTVSGPNITFHDSIKKDMQIDMRYIYGRDVGQILNIYDFAPDTYFSQGTFSFVASQQNMDTLLSYTWMGEKIGNPIHVWQTRANGTKNVIGELSNPIRTGNTVVFELKSQNSNIESGLDYTFASKGNYNNSFVLTDADITNEILNLKKDSDGRNILKDPNSDWFGTVVGKTYVAPFVYLSNGDNIKVEGETGFRKIKTLPTETTSKDGRPNEQTSDDIFGSVSVETYTGITRGEGLSVVAEIQNGSVISLTWNQRSYDPITQPTAYQYYTPPVLKFETLDGNGGGAKANVLVSKGQVISVDLLDGGSGYTKAPKVITTRRFDILSERDVGVSLINVAINPFVETGGMTALSVVTEIDESGLTGITGVSSLSVQVAGDAEIVLEREFTPDEIEVFSIGGALDPQRDYLELNTNRPTPASEVQVFEGPTYEATVVSAEVQDIVSLNSISTVSKVITQTQQIEIPNNAISNVNYFENAALLDLDFLIGDVIAYIADTSKFAPSGRLMIGDEVIYYEKKINDRFYQIIRGYQGTTEQDWVAGTYLRQIEDVTVISAGLVEVESESDVRMVNIGLVGSGFERQVFRQVTSPDDLDITKESTEVLIVPPPGGAVDGYEETAFINDPIQQRNQNQVDLIENALGNYTVTQRDGTIIEVRNELFGTNEYIGSYIKTTVGSNIGNWQYIAFDDGTADVSNLTIADISTYYPSLTLGDFVDRANSSFTKAGDKFNLALPSIQNPVAISSTVGTIGGNIVVQDTTYFPTTGYILHNNGTYTGIIKYTGKTANTFTGCTRHNGDNQIASGSEIVPISIV